MPYRLLDGQSVRDIPLSQWTRGLPDEPPPLDQSTAYGAVPWLYRCVNLRAQAVSSLPFQVRHPGSDQEAEWDQIVKLPRLLLLIEMLLQFYGAAYLFLERNQGGQMLNLKLLHPSTITPLFDEREGLVGFERNLEGQLTPERLNVEDVVYFWAPNPDSELGPGPGWVSVALAAAGLTKYANDYASGFFARGAIPAVLLSVEGNPERKELDRLEKWWKKLLQGVKKAWETIAIRAAVKPVVVGALPKDLAMQPLTTSARQQITVAGGIPQTLLEDAANYATAKEHRLGFYRETVIPEVNWIAAVLNEQLLSRLRLEIVFLPAQLPLFQQEQADQALALAKLVEIGILDLDEARERIGYEPRKLRELPPPDEDDEDNS